MEHAAAAMGRPGKLWPEESELIQLVREAQRGGPTALDALLTRLRPSFVAYFAPTMGRDDAEDAAQTALLSIVRALPRRAWTGGRFSALKPEILAQGRQRSGGWRMHSTWT